MFEVFFLQSLGRWMIHFENAKSHRFVGISISECVEASTQHNALSNTGGYSPRNFIFGEFTTGDKRPAFATRKGIVVLKWITEQSRSRLVIEYFHCQWIVENDRFV